MKSKVLPLAPAASPSRDDHEVAFPRKLARAKVLLARINLAGLDELTSHQAQTKG